MEVVEGNIRTFGPSKRCRIRAGRLTGGKKLFALTHQYCTGTIISASYVVDSPKELFFSSVYLPPMIGAHSRDADTFVAPRPSRDIRKA